MSIYKEKTANTCIQAPAIISFQIENGKFIKKMINLWYRSVNIRKFTLSTLKRYRKDGRFNKKIYNTDNYPFKLFLSSILVENGILFPVSA